MADMRVIEALVQHADLGQFELTIKKLERPCGDEKNRLIPILRGRLGQLRSEAAAKAAEASTAIDALEHLLEQEAAKASLRAV